MTTEVADFTPEEMRDKLVEFLEEIADNEDSEGIEGTPDALASLAEYVRTLPDDDEWLFTLTSARNYRVNHAVLFDAFLWDNHFFEWLDCIVQEKQA